MRSRRCGIGLVGTTQVTYEAREATSLGATSRCSFRVVVRDAEPPTFVSWSVLLLLLCTLCITFGVVWLWFGNVSSIAAPGLLLLSSPPTISRASDAQQCGALIDDAPSIADNCPSPRIVLLAGLARTHGTS